ncbi:BamA/TamA family outer membrane protein [Candidatus Acetothermia bacterium]|nr:BamA/TamA family outer membrane protein [Candidatus Acetothermia bacterium]
MMTKRSRELLRGFILIFAIITAILTVSLTATAVAFPVLVERIEIRGNERITQAEILAHVLFRPGERIEAIKIRESVKAILNTGKFREVIPRVEVERGKIIIIFYVAENPVLTEIIISGNITTEPVKVFGIKLYERKVLPTAEILEILAAHGVTTGEMLNLRGLEQALHAILARYEEKGFALIRIGEVIPEPVLAIEIIEGRVVENRIAGLRTVPSAMALDLIDLPDYRPVTRAEIHATIIALNESFFFDVVDIVPTQGPGRDELILLWRLSERIFIDFPTKITAVTFTGATLFSSEQLAAALGKLPVGLANNFAVLQSVAGVHALYHEAGYTMVKFNVRGVVGGELRLEIIEGRVAEILLEGNDHTQDFVIWRNLPIAVGDILNINRLIAAHHRLMGLGYFNMVDIVPEWIDDHIRLTVTITERRDLGSFMGAVALGPAGGIVGKIDYSQRNLFGTGQDLTLSFRQGIIADGTSSWSLSYSTVSFFPTLERVGWEVYRRTLGADVDMITTIGGRINLTYKLADFLDLGLSFTHEVSRTPIERWEPLSALTIALTYDKRNDPFFPTLGTVRNLSVEKAGGFAPGVEFIKIDMSWAEFFPLRLGLPFLKDKDQTFAFRVAGGFGIDLPGHRLYELGGATTIRGLDPTRSMSLLYLNVEYRIQFIPQLTGTIFWDIGTDFDLQPALERVKSSVGVEASLHVMGMHVRFFMAWPLLPTPERSFVPRFGFAFGPIF